MSRIEIPKLKTCPICEGTAAFKKVNVYGQDAYQVECRLCHLAIAPIVSGITGIGGMSHIAHMTITDAKHNAAIDWNKIHVHNDLWKAANEKVFSDVGKTVRHE